MHLTSLSLLFKYAYHRFVRRTAICRGAVYKGFLDGKVTGANGNEGVANIVAPIRVISTISRASYGVMYRDKFNFNQHLKEDKVWSPEQCEWRADNQMAWFLKRVGTRIPQLLEAVLTHYLGRKCLKDRSGDEGVLPALQKRLWRHLGGIYLPMCR